MNLLLVNTWGKEIPVRVPTSRYSPHWHLHQPGSPAGTGQWSLFLPGKWVAADRGGCPAPPLADILGSWGWVQSRYRGIEAECERSSALLLGRWSVGGKQKTSTFTSLHLLLHCFIMHTGNQYKHWTYWCNTKLTTLALLSLKSPENMACIMSHRAMSSGRWTAAVPSSSWNITSENKPPSRHSSFSRPDSIWQKIKRLIVIGNIPQNGCATLS